MAAFGRGISCCAFFYKPSYPAWAASRTVRGASRTSSAVGRKRWQTWTLHNVTLCFHLLQWPR